MNAFTLRLLDATRTQTIDGVTAFVGEDASGSFGLLVGHARLITTLVMGLARFRLGAADWHYLALPGAVLRFHDNVLTLSTRHFLSDTDYRRISAALQEELLAEEEQLHAMKESLRRMEQEVLRHLWRIGRGEAVPG